MGDRAGDDGGGDRGRGDWKTGAILFLGAVLAAAWLFFWGLRLVHSGRTVLGTVLLFIAVIVVMLPRVLGRGRGRGPYGGPGPPGLP